MITELHLGVHSATLLKVRKFLEGIPSTKILFTET